MLEEETQEIYKSNDVRTTTLELKKVITEQHTLTKLIENMKTLSVLTENFKDVPRDIQVPFRNLYYTYCGFSGLSVGKPLVSITAFEE